MKVKLRLREKPLVAAWCQGPRLQIGGLSIWSRVNSGGHNIASYHHPKSLTWRWLWYVRLNGKWSFHFSKWFRPTGSVTLYLGPLETGIHWQQHMFLKEPRP